MAAYFEQTGDRYTSVYIDLLIQLSIFEFAYRSPADRLYRNGSNDSHPLGSQRSAGSCGVVHPPGRPRPHFSLRNTALDCPQNIKRNGSFSLLISRWLQNEPELAVNPAIALDSSGR